MVSRNDLMRGALIGAIAIALVGGFAVPTFAQEGDTPAAPTAPKIVGPGGTAVTGSVSFEGEGDERVAVVKASIDGVAIELRKPVGSRNPTEFRISKREAAGGGAGRLREELLGEDVNPSDQFDMEVVFGPAGEDAPTDAPTDEPSDEPDRPDGDWQIRIVQEDGTEFTRAETRTFLVGQKVTLRALLQPRGDNGRVPTEEEIRSIRWDIPGLLIKSYRHDLKEGTDPFEHEIEHTVVAMTPDDLRSEDASLLTISVYFANDEQDKKVRVFINGNGKRRRKTTTIHVQRSELPALDVFTAQTEETSNFELLPRHSAWHRRYSGTDRFILFHRNFLDAYDAWRETFGYLPLEEEPDITKPGGGLEKPSYLSQEGGTERSPRHGAEKLSDFETLSNLGDDLESPWHNMGHMTEARRIIDGATPNSGMGSVARAPTREVFFVWHKKIDNVAKEWEHAASTRERTFEVEIVDENGAAVTEENQWLVGGEVKLNFRIKVTEEESTEEDPITDEDIEDIQWAVPGQKIKTFRQDEPEGSDPYEHNLEHTVTPFTAAHLKERELSFFWTDEGEGREIKLTLRAKGGATAEATVAVSTIRHDNPARELYMATGTVPSNIGDSILPRHSAWHFEYSGTERFILFHRNWLKGYNQWRETFGYLKVEAVESTDEPGGGLTPPSYLTVEGGSEESPRHDAKKLTDFETLSNLGDDLESPWHNMGHGVEARRTIDGARPNGDMMSVARAPLTEVFFIWHTKIDNKAAEWEYLKAQGGGDDGDDEPEEVSIRTLDTGSTSQITTARNAVVTTQEEWQALWVEAKSAPNIRIGPPPAVDFAGGEVVIARFMGEPGPGKTGIRNVVKTRESTVVNVDEVLFTPAPSDGDKTFSTTESPDIEDETTVEAKITALGPFTVDQMSVTVDIEHSYIGDLLIELVSPDGTTVVLHNRTGRGDNDIQGTFPRDLTPAESLDAFKGKPGQGEWTVRINDNARQDEGKINRVTLNFSNPPEKTSAFQMIAAKGPLENVTFNVEVERRETPQPLIQPVPGSTGPRPAVTPRPSGDGGG